MRGKQLRRLDAIFASRLICLGAVFTIALMTGCGGGNLGGGTTTTVTAVTVTPSTATLAAGASQSFSAVVSGTGNPSQAVTWSASPASAGTIDATGKFTASSTIIAITTATITAASTVPGYTSVAGSATVTVNPPAAQPPTATLTASPSTITAGSTTTLAWSSTNTTSCTASGAWSGTEATSGSVTETPSATATYTLTCTGADGSATASATVTVNPAPLPDISSVTPSTVYCTAECLYESIQIDGSGFATGQALTFSGDPLGGSSTEALVSSTQINLTTSFDTPHYSPGFITMDVCENANGTNCGTPGTLAFLGAQNYLAASSTGELFFLDQAQGMPAGQNGYVRKYKADGTAESSCYIGALRHSIAVDDKTGLFVVDGDAFDSSAQNNGVGCDMSFTPYAQNLPSGPIMATAARNGYTCFTQPSNNAAYCYPLTGGLGPTPFVTASNLGNMPEEIAMGLFGTETDAFVVSVDGTPSLYKVRASDGKVEGSLPLPGVTPISTVQATDSVAGGWQVVVFDSGPASGTVAVLSTYDHLLLLVNATTLTVTNQVVLTDTPFRIAADVTHGAVIVAYANLQNVTTTYASVDAASGTATPLLNTSSLLSVGLAVSSDGTNIYSSQRNQIEVKQNQ